MALVISYDNDPTDNTRFFVKTLEANGWAYTMLGRGEVWKGFITRVKAYNNYLASLDPNSIVLLSDARDVVCVRSPKAFMDAFRSFEGDFVVSMELFCGKETDVPVDFKDGQCIPLTNYWKYHNIQELPIRKFVNAGLVAGKAGAIQKWLQFAIDNNFENDQLALCYYINKFPERIRVDSEAKLLHTSTFGVNAGMQNIFVQAKDSPTFAEIYGRGAFFIHIPGIRGPGQNTVYNDVCEIIELGLSDEKIRSGYKDDEPPWTGYIYE